MVKSTRNQPDLLDAKRYLQASDALHGVSSVVKLIPDMTVNSDVWLLDITSVWPDLRETLGQAYLTTQVQFAGGDMSALGVALWTLCWRHDVALGKVRWKQLTLPSA